MGHHCQQKLAVCPGADRLFAFASVSPDGFRQGMPLRVAPPFGRRTEQILAVAVLFARGGRRIEAYSLDTAVPSGGQALADRLRFSSLCSEHTALSRFDCGLAGTAASGRGTRGPAMPG